MMITDFGAIRIRLSDSTPLHRNNFLKLVKQHYFDSVLFHRVIKGFMIQAGDPKSKMAKPGDRLGDGGPAYTVPAEIRESLFHIKGVIAAAREGDEGNPKRASSGSQFYIVQGKTFTDHQLDSIVRVRLEGIPLPEDRRKIYREIGGTPQLDRHYTVFGSVVEGLSVVDSIASTPTAGRSGGDRPLTDVRIRKAYLVKRKG